MTINDLELSELITEINLMAACLSTYCRNARESKLFESLSDIEAKAHRAQERLNEMKFSAPPQTFCKMEE